jgi:hypothetical protein
LGLVGAFLYHGQTIGTIRFIPMGFGLSPCEQVLREQPIDAALLEGSWEVGRLVLASRYRQGADTLRQCLFLTLVHLIEHTGVQNFFATSNPVLARLYRRFGFSQVARVRPTDPSAEPFLLIHASVQAVLEGLAADDAQRERAQALLELRRMPEATPC